jgi:hypothetical protein
VGLAGDGGLEVQGGIADRQPGRGVAHALQVVEVAVGVAGLTLGGVAEIAGDLGVALDVGDLGEIQVAAVGLALAGERVFEVLVGNLVQSQVSASVNGRTVMQGELTLSGEASGAP